MTSDYLPDQAAEGHAHTTFGMRKSKNSGPYLQGATFDESGNFEWRTDVTDHARPNEHPSPHRHKAKSPNGVEEGSCESIPWLN